MSSIDGPKKTYSSPIASALGWGVREVKTIASFAGRLNAGGCGSIATRSCGRIHSLASMMAAAILSGLSVLRAIVAAASSPMPAYDRYSAPVRSILARNSGVANATMRCPRRTSSRITASVGFT